MIYCINTFWFSVVMAVPLGSGHPHVCGCPGNERRVCVIDLYVAYAIPIMASYVFKNDFQLEPFNLGVIVSASSRLLS